MENETFKTEYIRVAAKKKLFQPGYLNTCYQNIRHSTISTKLPYQFIPKLSEITVNFEYFDLFTVRVALFFVHFDSVFDCLCSNPNVDVIFYEPSIDKHCIKFRYRLYVLHGDAGNAPFCIFVW